MKARLLMWPLALLALLTTRADADDVWPVPKWSTAKPEDAGLDAARLAQAREYALSGGGAGYITRGGKLVMSWGDAKKRFDLKSTTKSIGVTALGLAIGDGKLDLSDLARERHPSFGVPPESNAAAGWLDKITLKHLATQTAGFEKPGGYGKLLFEPGTEWAYSDGGPNWLAECVTLAYRRDLDLLMFERVFTPLGISRGDLVWRANSYRPHEIDGIARREFGAGISANVDAMARIGYLYLREGRWQDKQILPPEFVRQAAAVAPEVAGLPVVKPQDYGKASNHYGLLWWNNADGTLPGVPRDAFWSWGLYDSLIVVIPSLDIVASRAGASWKRDGGDHYDVLKPFLAPIAAAAKTAGEGKRSGANGDADRFERKAVSSKSAPARKDKQPLPAPYPSSAVIRRIEWAPASTIARRARGSDNWPLAWGDDDAIYTAYGDGRGFEPFVETKLSLGLAKISGGAADFTAENLRSSTAEQRGDGAAGKKASGLLMVDGTLYLLARNAGNSQLAWSNDRGATWTWADWKFTRSFGCPTFLNFGRNYDGARDDYVYVYSHDSHSAYEAADRMVLARVLRRGLEQSEAYEFFAGLDADGKPTWTRNIDGRSAVFRHPGRCYRSSISYNAALGRYLWCQVLPGEDPRFAGGLGIYDAAEPWGPWTTAYFAEKWGVAPGETASIPTKWIAGDGLSFYLVFSGEDHFSLRRANVSVVRTDP
jgi:CubicO group peptidase (beta-lactamase class C family)